MWWNTLACKIFAQYINTWFILRVCLKTVTWICLIDYWKLKSNSHRELVETNCTVFDFSYLWTECSVVHFDIECCHIFGTDNKIAWTTLKPPGLWSVNSDKYRSSFIKPRRCWIKQQFSVWMTNSICPHLFLLL